MITKSAIHSVTEEVADEWGGGGRGGEATIRFTDHLNGGLFILMSLDIHEGFDVPVLFSLNNTSCSGLDLVRG